MIKLIEPGSSRAGHARGLRDGRLPVTRRGEGESARAFSQVGTKSNPALVVAVRMAGRDGAS
jgi:hypothetical protein